MADDPTRPPNAGVQKRSDPGSFAPNSGAPNSGATNSGAPSSGAPPTEASSVAPANAIPRAALERVLARATELQGDNGEPTEAVSEARLLEVAREVGIDATHLRQAMAEERARIQFDEPGGGPVLDSLGAAMVSAQRVVPGSANDVQQRLDAWLPRMEGLGVRRKQPQRTSWEPRRDPLGNALRALGAGGRRFDLVRADQLIASVTPVDEAKSVVRFDVELSGARRSGRNLALGLGVGLNALLFATIAVPVLFLASGSPNAAGMLTGLAAVGVAQGAAGYGIFRAVRNSYRRTVARVQLRAEQLLDELEHGGMQAPPSVIGQVTKALLGSANKMGT